MITRTTIGADFEGALTYGAGVRQGDSPKKKAELIGSSNLVDVGNPRGLAAEMQGVADENSQCKNPVWHTSLSWAKGEQLSTEQKLKAAERYCELLRSQLSKKLSKAERAAYNVWEQHQVAVYEHKDKDHDHIHIYLNRVPVYGGPAIQTGHNYQFNLKAIRVISEELNLNPLPSQRQSFKDSRPPVQDTRQVVRAALVEAMGDPQVQNLAQLQERLKAQGIEARLKRSQAGQLVGVSFRQGQAAVTGQEVGMKAAQLRDHYEPAQRQAQGQVQQPAEVPAQLVGQVQQPVAADVVQEQAPAVQVVQTPPQAFQVAEVPQAMLTRFGWSVAKLEENGQLQKLLDGAITDILPMRFREGGGAPVDFEGRLALTRNENGAIELKMALPKKEAPQLAPVVQQPKPAAPEQRPVAAQPPAPELKPEVPKQTPPEPEKKVKRGRKLG
jgi:hypothetical protein